MFSLDLITFSLLLTAIIFISSWRSPQVSTERSYLLADNKTGFWALTATLVMTEFNTSTLIAFSSMGYLARWWALSLPLAFLIGLIFYSLSVAQKWKEFNGLSVAQFFTKRYNPIVGKLASLALLVAMSGFSAVYVKSLATLFALLFPETPLWLLSLFLTLLGSVLKVSPT
ncbi:MAG: hypothetical protein ACQEP8_06565 [Chlamydiota bacterium]